MMDDQNCGFLLSKQQAPIKAYASAMGVSLMGLLKDGSVVGYRDGLFVSATVETQQEAEALREVIRVLGQTLPAHRNMVCGDIGVENPEPTWRGKLDKMFGAATPASRAHLEGPKDDE